MQATVRWAASQTRRILPSWKRAQPGKLSVFILEFDSSSTILELKSIPMFSFLSSHYCLPLQMKNVKVATLWAERPPHPLRCCSKLPQAGRLINNMNLFLRSWSWKLQDQDTSVFDVWPEHIFLRRSCLLTLPFHDRKTRECSRVSS